MINFEVLLKPEDAAKFQNRQVEHVVESFRTSPMYGRMKTWTGSLAEEYFIVTFVNGYLLISVEEREMKLGSGCTTYAATEFLNNSLKAIDPADDEGRRVVLSGYIEKIAQKEQDELTFQDVMSALNWVLVTGKKIDEDWLAE